MYFKIFFSFLLLSFALSTVEASQSSKKKAAKHSPIEQAILKAKTRADFKQILSQLVLVDSFDKDDCNKTIDAAMKIPESNKLLVFYYVTQSATRAFNNHVYFDMFSKLSREETIELFESTSLFFSKIRAQHNYDTKTDLERHLQLIREQFERQHVYEAFQLIKPGKQYKLAQYINSITYSNMQDSVGTFIRQIASTPEDDLPDVMGHVMTVAKETSDYGISDLILTIRYIPKDRRYFILSEAKKLTTPNMNTIDKAHLIDGLFHLRLEDFAQIVDLGKQLFFEDTHGGHRSLTLKTIQNVKTEQRKVFVRQVKPFLKAEESTMLRITMIRILARFDENDRLAFIGYLTPNMNVEVKRKIFDNIECLTDQNLKTLISDLETQFSNKPVNEEKLLTAILSSVHRIKFNR